MDAMPCDVEMSGEVEVVAGAVVFSESLETGQQSPTFLASVGHKGERHEQGYTPQYFIPSCSEAQGLHRSLSEGVRGSKKRR